MDGKRRAKNDEKIIQNIEYRTGSVGKSSILNREIIW